MTAPTLRTALAPTFAWTSSGTDLALQFDSGTTPVNVTIPTGSYRMFLGGSTVDFLRVINTAVASAMTAASHSETVTFTLNAAGFVVCTVTGLGPSEEFSIAVGSPALPTLGLVGDVTTTSTLTATVQPWHIAYFIERVSNDWSQRTPIASAETNDGVGYGVTSGVTRWEDEITLGFIPRDPATVDDLGVYQTPWEPEPAGLTAVGATTGRAVDGDGLSRWSVSDVITESLGRTVGYAAGNLQALIAGTAGERYHLVTLPGVEIASPRVSRRVQGWDAYRNWTTRLVRQSATPTATR